MYHRLSLLKPLLFFSAQVQRDSVDCDLFGKPVYRPGLVVWIFWQSQHKSKIIRRLLALRRIVDHRKQQMLIRPEIVLFSKIKFKRIGASVFLNIVM